MTSTRSIDSAGKSAKAVIPFRPTRPDGFPSISVRTLVLPRNYKLPSRSRDKEGIFSNTSDTLVPLALRFWPTL